MQWVDPFAFSHSCLLIGVTDVEFRVTALCLQHLRSLLKLPRLAEMRRLPLARSSRRLIDFVSILVGHGLDTRRKLNASESLNAGA
jgi:hypothetical protein